jgi:hypothetical protein
LNGAIVPHQPNASEALFERFCKMNSILLERVQEATERRPDYRILQSKTHVVVEVKELQLTVEERAVVDCDLGLFDAANAYHWGIPGEKLRKKISNAVPQLKALSQSRIPSLLVVHDPTRFWPELLDADSVRSAMYGVEMIRISSEPAPEGGATILSRWHGARKKLTELHNTSLSAIGILIRTDDGLKLDVFHNWYAACPLSPLSLAAPDIVHYHLRSSPSDGFAEWISHGEADHDPS